MTKFKSSTHAQIDQRVKELLYPILEVGKTYRFNYLGKVVERKVIELDGNKITYGKPTGDEVTCQTKTFQRLYQDYGVSE